MAAFFVYESDRYLCFWNEEKQTYDFKLKPGKKRLKIPPEKPMEIADYFSDAIQTVTGISLQDAEDGLLGFLILYPGVQRRIGEVSEQDFSKPSNRKIFSAFRSVQRGVFSDIDPVKLLNALKSRGEYEEVGGGRELKRLIKLVPDNVVAIAKHYLSVVRHRSEDDRLP